MTSQTTIRPRPGFTLVELVVVILVLGIIAAVATPKMFDIASTARTNATQHSVRILRSAIELHKTQVGSFPTAANLKTALVPYLRGAFPSPQVGANQNSNIVVTTQNPISTPVAGGAGWVYNETTGDISVNDATGISW